MKFSHLADCHIGSWRDPKLSELSLEAFMKAIDISIEESVDFILISGDLFNTALPGIDRLKSVVLKLRELKDNDIPVYVIPGSHDFSPSGKTMLDVLESARLLVNVVKGKAIGGRLRLDFTLDKKTGAKITGMLGKKGMLEKNYYEDLDRENLEKEAGFKIFMLHTALTELKSEELEKMESAPISLLPKGFDYYAAGHVHEIVENKIAEYGLFVYPGPLFPNSFSELEKLKHGGFYLYDNGRLKYNHIKLYDVVTIKMDCTNMPAEQIESKLLDVKEMKDMIVLIRLYGKLAGKIPDLGAVIRGYYDNGAYFVMKNMAGLLPPEFEEIKITDDNIDLMEERIIKEHMAEFSEDQLKLTRDLMQCFSAEELDGERKIDFEKRVIEDADNVLRNEKIKKTS